MEDSAKKIRTMGRDIADFSTKPIPIRSRPFNNGTPEKKRSKIPKIISGVLFLMILIGGGWYAYDQYFSVEARKPKDETIPNKLINADEKIINLVTRGDLPNELSKLEKLDEGKFQIIFLSETKEDARHFLNPLEFSYAAELHPPEKLFNSIISYNFGVVGGGEKNYPFLILKISSSETALQGIEQWEKFLPQELSVLFSLEKNAEDIKNHKFENGIIKNQNVRIFNASSTQIIYSTYNQNLIIITSGEKAFADIISRYSIFPPN